MEPLQQEAEHAYLHEGGKSYSLDPFSWNHSFFSLLYYYSPTFRDDFRVTLVKCVFDCRECEYVLGRTLEKEGKKVKM